MPDHTIWFWQRIVSPHMAGLAAELSRQGCRVTYVAEQVMSARRAMQGWEPPNLGSVELRLVKNADSVKNLIKNAVENTIHIGQGIRANGLVGLAQRELAKQGYCQWIVMETVNDSGLQGFFKRFEYRRLFMKNRSHLAGILAIGFQAPEWVVARGMPAEKVYPFAYFLPNYDTPPQDEDHLARPFRFLFVGQFIKLKRLDMLVKALAPLATRDIEFSVIGSGPLETSLQNQAEKTLPGKVNWLGRMAISEVQQEMAKSDCLVLPSRDDGWGAVVSEALMVGTPAICSDRCGSAGVVEASGVGGVFPSGNRAALSSLLEEVYLSGRLKHSRRSRMASWAKCLGAVAGANYLKSIFDYQINSCERPQPPWEK